MTLLLCISLAVLFFFGVALYAVRVEENRREDRRQQDLPVTVERRVQDRRQPGFFATLRWALRRLASKWTR